MGQSKNVQGLDYRGHAGIECRREDPVLGNVLVGYAARFFDPQLPEETQTRLGPHLVERIHRGAFRGVAKRDVVALAHHDQARPLGRVSAGTLKLALDDQGLRFEVQLPETTDGRDVREQVRTGLVNGSSFGFMVRDENFASLTTRAGRLHIRNLTDIDLFEVSPVTMPANPEGTTAELRCISVNLHTYKMWQSMDRLRELRLHELELQKNAGSRMSLGT